MKKKANISLISDNDNINIFTDIEIINNKINYIYNDTNVFYNILENILIRDDKEKYLEYNFNKNKGIIYIKDIEKELVVDIEVINLINKDNYIEIEYKLENQSFKYIINME